MIAIIDYGMGNLRSVQKGFERVGYAAEVTRDPRMIESARGVVLPGVGAFSACMANLQSYGVIDSVYRVIESGVPFLGICLGMQLLFSESEEYGPVKGLDILKGRVVRFNATDDLKIPHMGWNKIKKNRQVSCLQGIADESYVYFVHSYYPVPEDQGAVTTTTSYGVEFASSIQWQNVFACQFHPEKSQAVGLRILENFGAVALAHGDHSRH